MMIKTTPDELGVPSFDIEQEAYKFSASNGLGRAGVRMFYSSFLKLGKNASLVEVRKYALELHDASKAITDRITKTQEATHKVIDEKDIDEKYSTPWNDR